MQSFIYVGWHEVQWKIRDDEAERTDTWDGVVGVYAADTSDV